MLPYTTPLKRITPWAVLVGAFLGAIPPMLGGFKQLQGKPSRLEAEFYLPYSYVAVSSFLGPMLWKINDDYLKSGVSNLLPSPQGRDFQLSAFSNYCCIPLFMDCESFLALSFFSGE